MCFYFTYWVVSGDFIQRKGSLLKKKNPVYFSHTVGETIKPEVSWLQRPQGLIIESPLLSRFPFSGIVGEGVVISVFLHSFLPQPVLLSFSPAISPSILLCNRDLLSTVACQPQPYS